MVRADRIREKDRCMKVSTLSLLFTVVLLACLVSEGHGWFSSVRRKVRQGARFAKGAARGARDMYRGYSDMRKANWKNSDKYFHARANHDAARHGPGGRWAARVISNARENWQSGVSGRGHEDTRADQEANRWGRNGGDPNRYRPKNLPDQYMKVSTLSLLLTVVILACLVSEGHGWFSRSASRGVSRGVRRGAKFVKGAALGARDMYRGYKDMRDANWKNSDKYFHARANHDAARHGPGGRWAAKVISDARENWQSGVSGRGHEDTRADQEANRWGRNGGDPNKYRPAGLPSRY
ncbi:LOW QUALITY PROTEIN: uncharacterized protein LOC117332300 [Pecten maximus]|uniref:LOW QUALITY PROTEIN: uncharacterized protein LOC117332300 n=1 Tax=Pecten maximus TaxID=6579 RepID=UPI0014580F05|nr:LOW QUALITY PROTEIN: uncharacterized protein LOC117332300 [Pecten maximus]